MSIEWNPLAHRLCFAQPHRLIDIQSWHEHIQFAFACIEMLKPRVLVELGTHKGDSYCAFCQAVDMLGLETNCYAVDHWKGDEQAGYYGPEVLKELRSYHDPLYDRFSRLIQSSFDEALAHFADGSVDLLHIDGLHMYKAAKHDFGCAGRGMPSQHEMAAGHGFRSPYQPDKERRSLCTVPDQGRSRRRALFVLPLSVTGRSHLGNLSLDVR